MRINPLAWQISAVCLFPLTFTGQAHAAGPWGFGPFSSLGGFESAYEACEVWTRDHLQIQAATYLGFEVKYRPLMTGLFGTTGGTCQAVGQKGNMIYESTAVSLSYNGKFSEDPFDPATCDLFTREGECYVRNHGFNLGEPLVAENGDCTGKQGPSLAAGNPINIATGNKYQREVDVAFFGNDVSLELVRHYNSRNSEIGVFGKGWSSDFTSSLELVEIFSTPNPAASAKPVKTLRIVTTADGRRYEFENKGGVWTTTTNIVATLTASDTGFVFEDDTRTRLSFNAQGQITQMTDAQGLSLHYGYGAADQLATIKDDFGHTLSLTYAGGLVNTATVAGHGTFTYGYDAQRLTTVKFQSVQAGAKETIRTYVYDDPNGDHLLTGIIDENNQRFATWSYDDQGRAVSSEHGDNGAEKVTINYDARVRTIVTNALEKEKVYSYVDIYGVKQILRIDDKASENCPASNQQFTYDGKGLLETVTDGEGVVTRYERNGRGLPTLTVTGLEWAAEVGGGLESTEASQEITTQWYANFDELEYEIVRGLDNDGVLQDYRRIDYKLDARGRVREQTVTDLTDFADPYATNGRTRTTISTYEYFTGSAKVKTLTVDGPRAITDIEGGMDDITTFTYDESGHLTALTNALGHKITYADFNALGFAQTVTDENGVITKITYDAQGALDTVTVKTTQGDAVTNYDYHPNGLLHKVTLADQSSLTFGYDAARQLTSLVNNFGERIDLTPNLINGEWKERSLKKSASSAVLQTGERVYDELGRVMHLLGNDGQKTVLRYDSNDRVEDIDEEGHEVLGTLETRHVYDALGRLSQTTDAKAGVTDFGYDGQDNLVSVTDANQHATTYVVDGFGETIMEVSPDRGTTVYWYDNAGNLKETRDANNITTTFKYDALSRPVSRTDTKDGSVSWVYDLKDAAHPNGITRLSRITDASGTTDFAYTQLGQLAKEVRTFAVTGNTSFAATTEYRYDLAGNLTGMTYPGGRVVTYKTAQGRVNTLTTQAGASASEQSLLTSIAYTPFGGVEAYSYGNSLRFAKAYDLDGRVDTLNLSYSGESKLHLTFGYDPFNNVNSVVYKGDAARDKSFDYDALHQLDLAEGPYGEIDYDYDAVGNRTSRTITHPDKPLYSETYNYPWPNNRLESVEKTSGSTASERTYGYDEGGNITSVSGDKSQTLHYDAQNQLRSVSPATN